MMQVTHVEGTDMYELKSGLTGQQLFDMVVEKLGMAPITLFSFQYVPSARACWKLLVYLNDVAASVPHTKHQPTPDAAAPRHVITPSP